MTKCIVCCHNTDTKGMLRGVCKTCQVDVFVKAHLDEVAMHYSERFDRREADLKEREKAVAINEKGIALIKLLKEIL